MKYVDRALLIHSENFQNKLSSILDSDELKKSGCRLMPISVDKFTRNPTKYRQGIRHIICFVRAEELRPLINFALDKGLSIGLLRPPTLLQPLVFSNFDIPRKFAEGMDLALQIPQQRYDILRCNGELVLGCLNLGEFPFYNNTDITRHGDPVSKRLRLFFSNLVRLFFQHPQPVSITTAKGKTIHTAVTGIAVVENAARPFFYVTKDDSQSTRDRQISVLLLAPSSIISYLKLLLYTLFQNTESGTQQGLGYIKSHQIIISGQADLKYTIDGENYQEKELVLELTPGALAINAGPDYAELNEEATSDKERIAVDRLPQNETRVKYLAKSLPFFPHALEEDFKDLFINLRESGAITSYYLLLMILSTMLASLGLFLDSPSVVIGAMVLAPLMAPIVSLAMGFLRDNTILAKQSFITLATGILLAVIVSASMAYLLPYEKATNEILARLHPSLLDLMVAIVSGIAGAYATAREHVAKSLPGVAIAVALVPPLCVSGIGLGWWNLEVFQGALLLFFTNLVGIILAASTTFLVMGYAPFSRAAKGMALSMVMAGIVAVPLFYSFLGIIQSAQVEHQLANQRFNLNGREFNLKEIRIRNEQTLHIHAALHSRDLPDNQTLDQLQTILEKEMKKPVKLELSFHLER